MSFLGKKFTEYALKIDALELVPELRKLKSGRDSPYFFNSGRFDNGERMHELALGYASLAKKFQSDVIFGPAYKGISLAAMTTMQLWNMEKINLGFAYNRKEEKTHGEGGTLVGANIKDKRVLLIDDVITTGETKNEAVELVKKHGGRPVGCIIAFDRKETVSSYKNTSAVNEFEMEHGIPVCSIANVRDLLELLEEESHYPENKAMAKLIGAYQTKYGAV